MNKDKVKELLKQPSTYAGVAAILIAAFGLDSLSAEQIATVMAGLAAVFITEKKF